MRACSVLGKALSPAELAQLGGAQQAFDSDLAPVTLRSQPTPMQFDGKGGVTSFLPVQRAPPTSIVVPGFPALSQQMPIVNVLAMRALTLVDLSTVETVCTIIPTFPYAIICHAASYCQRIRSADA